MSAITEQLRTLGLYVTRQAADIIEFQEKRIEELEGIIELQSDVLIQDLKDELAVLKEAIKQQGEPVAWIGYDSEGGTVIATNNYGINGRDALVSRGFDMKPLYTSLQSKENKL
jgi:hypothetical protein